MPAAVQVCIPPSQAMAGVDVACATSALTCAGSCMEAAVIGMVGPAAIAAGVP
jgi:hypothetical protein